MLAAPLDPLCAYSTRAILWTTCVSDIALTVEGVDDFVWKDPVLSPRSAEIQRHWLQPLSATIINTPMGFC